MLETRRNGFVTHAVNSRDDFSSSLIASINSVDRLGYYGDFLDILKKGEVFRLSVEKGSFSALFEIDPGDFSEKFEEFQMLNN